LLYFHFQILLNRGFAFAHRCRCGLPVRLRPSSPSCPSAPQSGSSLPSAWPL
jgi:hypothetical protein